MNIYNNTDLADCCAIGELLGSEPNGVGGTISIYNNESGCDYEGEVLATCPVSNSFVAPNPNGQAFFEYEQVDEQAISVFPNPAAAAVSIQISRDFEAGEVRLYDLRGRLIFTRPISGGALNQSLNLSDIGKGVYLLRGGGWLDGEAFQEKLLVN